MAHSAIGWAGLGLVAIFVLSLATSPVLDAGEEQGLLPEEWDSDKVVPYIVVGLSITFVGPIAEELMFRGVGFALLAPYGKWVAIIGTGVLFGALHGLLIALPVLSAFGVILGWVDGRPGACTRAWRSTWPSTGSESRPSRSSLRPP